MINHVDQSEMSVPVVPSHDEVPNTNALQDAHPGSEARPSLPFCSPIQPSHIEKANVLADDGRLRNWTKVIIILGVLGLLSGFFSIILALGPIFGIAGGTIGYSRSAGCCGEQLSSQKRFRTARALLITTSIVSGMGVFFGTWFAWETSNELQRHWAWVTKTGLYTPPEVFCAAGCNPAFVSDGYCDSECFTSECQWDGTDCGGEPNEIESESCNDQGCPPYWVGDGYCDEACNNRFCSFDENDCSNGYNSRPARPSSPRGLQRIVYYYSGYYTVDWRTVLFLCLIPAIVFNFFLLIASSMAAQIIGKQVDCMCCCSSSANTVSSLYIASPPVSPHTGQVNPCQTATQPVSGAASGPFGLAPGGVYHREQYCGIISWLIGILICPCICFCPVDSRMTYTEPKTGQMVVLH